LLQLKGFPLRRKIYFPLLSLIIITSGFISAAIIINKVINVVPSLEDDSQLLFNLTGHPCITFTNGFTSKGMPTSITFVGNLYDEGVIISAANQFQLVTNFNKKHPSLKW
jgi:Asp-tRNA(Asn)/Glu-tRNA(Gln) amidotransferase A subunit family amidase